MIIVVCLCEQDKWYVLKIEQKIYTVCVGVGDSDLCVQFSCEQDVLWR